MSQPWRPSRGAGSSKWGNVASPATPNHSNNVSSRQSTMRMAGRSGEGSISSEGMRQANLKPVREQKMDFSSPSRGELAPGKSLTDTDAQEEYRAHLETKAQVHNYRLAFPDELGIIIGNHQQQRDALELLLLDFRKLREGIISAGRNDAFAVEVYETSAKLAIFARSVPQIASILPHLVKSLHRPRLKHASGSNDIETALQRMSVVDVPVIDIDRQARYASYYLLHLVCHMNDMVAFQTALRDLVDLSVRASKEARSTRLLPAENQHIAFALNIFRAYIGGNYASLHKIVSQPLKHDKFAWTILRSGLDVVRKSSWNTLRVSYMAVDDQQWLGSQLLLDSEKDLHSFLQKEGWPTDVGNSKTITLKRAIR